MTLELHLGVKMSCMKNLVLSGPVIDVVDPDTILTSSCVIKVSYYNRNQYEKRDVESSRCNT